MKGWIGLVSWYVYLYWLLWFGYAGSSLEVKIETDSNDAVEIKTEADSNDIAECSHVHAQSISMFISLFNIYVPWSHLLLSCLC